MEQGARLARTVRPQAAATVASARDAAVASTLVIAIAVGVVLRFGGLDWDEGHHLHPDERYLSIVANDIRGPSSLGGYFDVGTSPLSPYNVGSGSNYVYGQLPLLGVKALAAALGRDDYGELYLVGRHVSSLLDVGSIVLVFLIGRLLFAAAGRRAALGGASLAAALYALTVTAIQHAHFFTVESWLVFFTLLAFLLAALAVERRAWAPGWSYGLLATAGGATGLAVSAKLSGGIVALALAVALLWRALAASGPPRARALRLSSEGLVAAVGGYVAFRLTSPYAFASSSWLDVRPQERFRSALEQQRQAVSGDFLFPPAYQWLLSDRFVDPARNLLGWGLGPALGLAAVAGLVTLAVATVRAARRKTLSGGHALVVAVMLLLYVGVSFAYFGSLFAHSLRYLLPLAPFLCLAAAAGLLALRRFGIAAPVAGGAVLAATLAWALAFTAVYREPNTRVAASEWILANVPSGATVVNEHWDDGLPVAAPPERYTFRELRVFDPDDGTKLAKLHAILADADLYVLSSPRAWRTIGRLPGHFPLMTRFYDRLRAGELGWQLVARFRSEPRLLGLAMDDLGAEETFWVYDHPPVELYRRTETMSRAELTRRLCPYSSLSGCP